MNNAEFTRGADTPGIWQSIRGWFRRLFGKKSTETFIESRIESRWEQDYRIIDEMNFTEIFANRLTNYTLCDSSFECDDEEINKLVFDTVDKSYKWCQMAFGVGRVFLIPYMIGDRIYTDIVPQGRAWVTKIQGDDILGIGVVADIREKNRNKYYRLTSYEYDPDAKTFTIENKATNQNGAEVGLNVFEDWADIEPFYQFNAVEMPLFAFCDCPKDNRTTDKLQGASITYGCKSTIDEIKDTMRQYLDEYQLKEAWLGVDRIMLGKDGKPDSRLFKTFDGKSTDDLFEIFSPDIRTTAYHERLMDLFGRLEKQVGTSNGILTPADTANATATQVRRSMYDTLAIVRRMQTNIETAFDRLCYCFKVYLGVLGKSVSDDYKINIVWGQSLTSDQQERFQQLMQARGSSVKDEEIRQFLYPAETAEEAAEAVRAIRENAPEPQIPDFFGE